MNIWKILAITFGIILLIETLGLIYVVKLGSQYADEEIDCMIYCANKEYESYSLDYSLNTRLCYCWVGKEAKEIIEINNITNG